MDSLHKVTYCEILDSQLARRNEYGRWKFVENLLAKCAAKLGMDWEPEEEKEKTEEQRQIREIKEWLREGRY